jgi:hypothetical protein
LAKKISYFNCIFVLLRFLQIQTGPCGTEALSFLPPESIAALFNLGNSVVEKIARLRINSSIETEGLRQAKYLNWCQIKMIPEACGNEYEYERILACFVENLITDCHSRSATVLGYVQAINKLFELRKFPIPADLSDRTNMISKSFRHVNKKKTLPSSEAP